MAFLRFTRDKRGYEHFYLVEASTNRRGKTRARVLYWFRTPPGVKVGREPFDDDVRRTLEAQYPGITFDWRKIVETPIPSAEAERWRERRRAEKAEKAARRAASAAVADVGETTEGAENEPLDPDEAHEEALAATDPGEVIDAGEPLEPSELVEPTAFIEAMEDLEEDLGSQGSQGSQGASGSLGSPGSSVPPTDAVEPAEPREPGEPAEPREPRSHRRRRRRRRGRRPDGVPSGAVAPATTSAPDDRPASDERRDPGESSGE